MPLSHPTVAKMFLIPYLLLVVILDVNHVIDDNHSNVSFQTVMYFILPIISICVNAVSTDIVSDHLHNRNAYNRFAIGFIVSPSITLGLGFIQWIVALIYFHSANQQSYRVIHWTIIVLFPLVASVIGIDALLSWKRYRQIQDPSQYVLYLGNV